MPKKISVDKTSPEYDSADEAAHALLDKFSAGKGKGQEQAGVLYKNPNGKYQYSEGLYGSNDDFQLAAQIPHGYSLVGIAHTHPSDDETSQVFSPNDVATANSLKIPSYIRFQKDGSTRRYTPGVTATDLTRVDGMVGQQRTAVGDPVKLPAPQTSTSTQPLPPMSPMNSNLLNPAKPQASASPLLSKYYV